MLSIKHHLWNGAINIRLHYNSEQYLLRAHRIAYFPVYFDEISQYFGIDGCIWLSHDGTPIKWNLPIGVLYDCFSTGAPWELTINTDNYPSESIIPFIDSDDPYLSGLRRILINSWKQANFVVSGTAKMVMSLSGPDTNALLDAICSHNLLQYEQVVSKIGLTKCKRVPVRLVQKGGIVKQFPIGEDEMLSDVAVSATVHGVRIDNCTLGELWRSMCFLDGYVYVVETSDRL